MPKVCVGGSFNILHAGHRRLLQASVREAAGGEIVVGLTSDSLSLKGYVRPEFETRKRRVERLLAKLGALKTEVVRIDGDYSPELAGERKSRSAGGFSVIVVSEETKETAAKLNRARVKNRLNPLRVVTVPFVFAADSLPIAARRIAAEEIDSEGRMSRGLRVAVGSTNPVKLAGVQAVFDRVFHRMPVKVQGVEPPRGPAQPWGDETKAGAIRRAKAAIRKVPGAHYGLGVEAGVFEEGDDLMDVQFCAIVDRKGEMTIGHGPGFAYPAEMAKHLRRGRTVSQATHSEFGLRAIGRQEGAIGVITKLHWDRKRLTEGAVLAALAPRIHRMSEAFRA